MKRDNKELASFYSFLMEKVDAGELGHDQVQDVLKLWRELGDAFGAGDHHMVMVVVGEIAKRFLRHW